MPKKQPRRFEPFETGVIEEIQLEIFCEADDNDPSSQKRFFYEVRELCHENDDQYKISHYQLKRRVLLGGRLCRRCQRAKSERERAARREKEKAERERQKREALMKPRRPWDIWSAAMGLAVRQRR